MFKQLKLHLHRSHGKDSLALTSAWGGTQHDYCDISAGRSLCLMPPLWGPCSRCKNRACSVCHWTGGCSERGGAFRDGLDKNVCWKCNAFKLMSVFLLVLQECSLGCWTAYTSVQGPATWNPQKGHSDPFSTQKKTPRITKIIWRLWWR